MRLVGKIILICIPLAIVLVTKALRFIEVYSSEVAAAASDANLFVSCSNPAWRESIGHHQEFCEAARLGKDRSAFLAAIRDAIHSLWPCYLMFGCTCNEAIASAWVFATSGSITTTITFAFFAWLAAQVVLTLWRSSFRLGWRGFADLRHTGPQKWKREQVGTGGVYVDRVVLSHDEKIAARKDDYFAAARGAPTGSYFVPAWGGAPQLGEPPVRIALLNDGRSGSTKVRRSSTRRRSSRHRRTNENDGPWG